MLGVRTVKITKYDLNHHHTNTYGGYLTYWKLYRQLLKMSKNTGIRPNIFYRFKSFVWLCLLKPLGCVYSKTLSYIGEFEIKNDYYTNKTLVKSRTHKLFGIQFWKRTLEITDEDIIELTK